jgi:hypothetical protein
MRGADAMLVDDWTSSQLWIPATRIGGGTEEALRNVVAERVLGLPRQLRTGDTFRGQGPENRHQLEPGA